MIKFNILAVFLFMISLSAYSKSPTFNYLTPEEQSITDIQSQCASPVCHGEFEFIAQYNTLLTPKIESILYQIAEEQTSIWYDTILEGDYQVEGEVRLDNISVILKNGNLAAYHITYSQKAWETSECEFDGNQLETLKKCTPGRIFESSYVTPNMNYFEVDENRIAEFQ